MTKWKTWAVAALGVLGIAFLSGAFESFMKWDREKSAVMNGLMTVGLAVAGAFAAHSFGVIDGDTRNAVVVAGVALGAAQAFGGKVRQFGSDVASKFNRKGSSPRVASDGLPDTDRDVMDNPVDGFANNPGIMNNATGNNTGGRTNTAPAGSGPAPQPTAPVYNITYEAAKTKGPSDLAYVGGELFKSLGTAFQGTGFGLGGSGADRQELIALGNIGG